MWATLRDVLGRLWDWYLAFVTPLYPWIQWGIGIGAVMFLLGWSVRKIARQMTTCPQCGRVIPKTWNPCRMCGYQFPQTPT